MDGTSSRTRLERKSVASEGERSGIVEIMVVRLGIGSEDETREEVILFT
jgi:hypothetical protein